MGTPNESPFVHAKDDAVYWELRAGHKFTCYFCRGPMDKTEGYLCDGCFVFHCNACERVGFDIDPYYCLDCSDAG
jgi:hypothetical protein